MPNLTSVGVTAGVPTSGTGTVSTIDNLIGTAGTASASVVSIQGISSMTKILVTPDANSAINVAQIGGASAATGSGAINSGTQRIALATDSPGVVTLGQAAMTASLPVTVANNQATISTSPDTSLLMNGATGITLTPKFKVITASSSGATTIVAAVSSKKIRVLQWIVTTNAAVNFKWQSHVTPTDLTGLYYSGAQGGAGGSFCHVGHFETIAGEALDINLSGAVAVGGSLVYVEV